MRKVFLAAVLGIFFCVAQAAGQESVCSFPGFSQQIVRAVTEAYHLHQSPAVPVLEHSVSGDEKIRTIWSGEVPAAESAVQRARIWFASAAGEKFFIEAAWSPDAVTLRHSQPVQPGLAGGLRIPWESAEKNLLLQGRNRSGFFLGKPATKKGNIFPVILCPRDEPLPDSEHEDNQLVDPGLELIGFEADVQAVAEGVIKSSLGASKARAEIQTTSYVRASAPWYDESQARHPRVRLEYRPDSAWQMPEFDAASFSPQGLRTRVEMTNSGGYKVVRSHDARVGLEKITLGELPRIQSGARTFYPDDGLCYLLIRQDVLADEYSFSVNKEQN